MISAAITPTLTPRRPPSVRRRRPWVWIVFLVTMVLYAFGYVADSSSASVKILLPGVVLWLFTLILTVAEAKDLVLMRDVLRSFFRGRLMRSVSDAQNEVSGMRKAY